MGRWCKEHGERGSRSTLADASSNLAWSTISKGLRYTSCTQLGSHPMAVGIRRQDLRKVYSSAPPLGAAGGFIARADAKDSGSPNLKSPPSTDSPWKSTPERFSGCSARMGSTYCCSSSACANSKRKPSARSPR